MSGTRKVILKRDMYDDVEGRLYKGGPANGNLIHEFPVEKVLPSDAQVVEGPPLPPKPASRLTEANRTLLAPAPALAGAGITEAQLNSRIAALEEEHEEKMEELRESIKKQVDEAVAAALKAHTPEPVPAKKA